MHFRCLSLKFKCLSLKILYSRRVISGGKSMILIVIFFSWLPAIVFDNVNGTDEEVPSLVKYTIRMDSDRVDSTKKIRNKWVWHLMLQQLFCLHSECFRIPNFFMVSYVLYWHCTSQKGHSPLFIVHARSVALSKPTLDSCIRGAQCFLVFSPVSTLHWFRAPGDSSSIPNSCSLRSDFITFYLAFCLKFPSLEFYVYKIIMSLCCVFLAVNRLSNKCAM